MLFAGILVLISHSQDFLNGVCTNIIHIDKKRLKYYGGNYEAFCRTRMEQLENQTKQYNWEQDQIAHMKNYIARFGHGSAKLARQAQSKEKTLAKMVAQGLTDKVVDDKTLSFYFPSCGTVPPPVSGRTKCFFCDIQYSNLTNYLRLGHHGTKRIVPLQRHHPIHL